MIFGHEALDIQQIRRTHGKRAAAREVAESRPAIALGGGQEFGVGHGSAFDPATGVWKAQPIGRGKNPQVRNLLQSPREKGYKSIDEVLRAGCGKWIQPLFAGGSLAEIGRAGMNLPQAIMRWRVPLGYAFAALYLAIARPATLGLFFGSAALVVLGCALRSWAAGYLIKGTRVAVGGPYAYVRNPLYAGSFLIGLGCCAALWRQPLSALSVVLWLVFLATFFAVYPLKARLEEKELLATLGGAYAGYAGKVPAFLPWNGRVPDLGTQPFSGEIYLQNREYQCLLGAAGVLSFLFLRCLLGW